MESDAKYCTRGYNSTKIIFQSVFLNQNLISHPLYMGLDIKTFGNRCRVIKLSRTTLGGARAQEKGKLRGGNQHNQWVNLPGGSLYGFGRLHIPLDDV